ncbi:MAG: T9SS type A sorting domain-containing protein, partial [Bacteroidota bacterium]
PEAWNTGTIVVFPDDEFSPTTFPIGFDFCFMGVTVSDFVISSNGYISFRTANAGNYSDYIPRGIPRTNNQTRDAIFGSWYDLDPSQGGTIRYNLSGTAPNRIMTVKFRDVPHFDCSTDLISQQIRLFETSGIIDIHLENQVNCGTWDNGRATLGVNNATGTAAIAPPARNNDAWAGQEAWRFTPCVPCDVLLEEIPLALTIDCAPVPTLHWNGPNMDHVAYALLRAHSADGFLLLQDTLLRDAFVTTAQSGTLERLPHASSYILQLFDASHRLLQEGQTLSDCPAPRSLAAHYRDKVLKVTGSTDFSGPSQFQVLDLQGKYLAKWSKEISPGPFGFDWRIEGLKSGIYLLQMAGNGEKMVTRFLVSE